MRQTGDHIEFCKVEERMVYFVFVKKAPGSLYFILCETFRASLAFGYLPWTWMCNHLVLK